MRLLVVAVGNRMPGWVNESFADYAKRFGWGTRLELAEVRAEPRGTGRTTEGSAARLVAAERTRIEAKLPAQCARVALDEHGRDFTTVQLSQWMAKALGGGRDVAFMIGGPDGLDPALKSGADLLLRLSSLTLPHGLARVLLAEQLYRALSILNNHPYHRE
ncbi:MAG: 23S rRNA (pseudouridine(1915)-N(3))-methyltransferase RlmH [Betaproteobacteria bacterium]|nr:23S rRNA (pseudouridine(1915)-N(3))-methyltransferase RlmH [Betaproteobacteria bacterium]